MLLYRWFHDFRHLPRAIFVLAGARCINTFGFSIVMPYLAYHLTAHVGVEMTTVGLIYTIAGVSGATAQLVGGELADRVGRQPVMLVSLGLRALVMVALGLAVLHHAPVGVIGGLVVVNAILRSSFEPAAQAQAALLAGSKGRTAAFGLQRIGVNLGWALGPALGGIFAARSYGLMFFVAGAVTVVAVGGCALVPDQPAGARALSASRNAAGLANARLRLTDLLDVPRPRAFLIFLGFTLLMSILTTQLFSTMSVYAMTRLQIPERRFGLLYSVNGIMVVALQGPAVRFISRFGIRRSLIIGPLIYAAGYLAVGLSATFSTLALAVALVTVGELLTEPSEMCAAVALGDPARPGRAMGIFGLISSLGNSLGPGVGGVLYDHTRGQPLALWWTIAGLGVIGSAGYNAIGPIDDEPASS